jgi:hypothetical protein
MYLWPTYPDYRTGAAYVISSDVAANVHDRHWILVFL